VKLAEIGFEVLGVDLTKTGDSRFKEIEMDFFSDEINRYLDENSILIHLAAISTDSESKKSPLKAININIAGTQKLMEICKDRKISKFIFASSEWVYPENSIAIPQFETDVLSTSKLNSVYALSKLMTEDFIRVNSDNLNYSILRFGIVYGPRNSPGSSLESLALKVWKNQDIEIGSGLTDRNLIYVEITPNRSFCFCPRLIHPSAKLKISHN
jgi:nucleoside-diphosphate-sugar epimerase